MAQEIPSGQSMLIIRREAYERAGLTRQSIDERLNLTPEEFRVDGRLVMIGPIPDDAGIREFLDDLEGTGSRTSTTISSSAGTGRRGFGSMWRRLRTRTRRSQLHASSRN